jgi:stress-induced morphogen
VIWALDTRRSRRNRACRRSDPAPPGREHRPGVAMRVGTWCPICASRRRAWQCLVGVRPATADMRDMQPNRSDRAARLEAILSETFAPAALVVTDDSARHAGHAGSRPGGQTHYSVLLVSERFAGMSRLARSRAVHAALAAEFDLGLHALGLTLRTPSEHASATSGHSGDFPSP